MIPSLAANDERLRMKNIVYSRENRQCLSRARDHNVTVFDRISQSRLTSFKPILTELNNTIKCSLQTLNFLGGKKIDDGCLENQTIGYSRTTGFQEQHKLNSFFVNCRGKSLSRLNPLIMIIDNIT